MHIIVQIILFANFIIGIVNICYTCWLTEPGNSELADKCLMPSQHRESQRIFAAWNSYKLSFEQIRPRPKVALKGRFVLCYYIPACTRRSCTYAHSKLECDAWNDDLIKERNGHSEYHVLHDNYS